MSKFKVGDRVIRLSRSWGELQIGDIGTITWAGPDSVKLDNGGDYTYDKSAFELYKWEPRQGDMVEVSDNGKDWYPRLYIGFDIKDQRHIGKKVDSKENFYLGWAQVREPQPKHIIVIDGESIELSAESFNALKKSLIK